MASVHSNRAERRAWRREAFASMRPFFEEFDPDKLVFAILKKEGMDFADACKRMAHDPDCDPMMLANDGPGLAGLGEAVKEAWRRPSASLEEKLRQLGRSTDDT
jgi:hypothetical protein